MINLISDIISNNATAKSIRRGALFTAEQEPRSQRLVSLNFGNTKPYSIDGIYNKQTDIKDNTISTRRAFRGDTTYGFNTNISEDQSIIYANLDKLYNYPIALTIADDAGIDTIDASGFKKPSTIDLHVMTRNETQSRLSKINSEFGNLSLAPGTIIENAIGGQGDDLIYDNQFNNSLSGKKGNDLLFVSGGKDEITGGRGFDTAIIRGKESDFIVYNTHKSETHWNRSTPETILASKSNPEFQVKLREVEEYTFSNQAHLGTPALVFIICSFNSRRGFDKSQPCLMEAAASPVSPPRTIFS